MGSTAIVADHKYEDRRPVMWLACANLPGESALMWDAERAQWRCLKGSANPSPKIACILASGHMRCAQTPYKQNAPKVE